MKTFSLACMAVFLMGSAHGSENRLNVNESGSRAVVSGKAIVVQTSQAYAFQDTNIRIVLVNHDLYAMLDKYSATTGQYVACAEIYDSEQFAERQMYTTDFFGINHRRSIADKWRQRVAADAVGKQASYVGFDCKVGSMAELAPIVGKIAVAEKAKNDAAAAATAAEAMESERRGQNERTWVENVRKFQPLFGNYSSAGKIVADYNLFINYQNDHKNELYLNFSYPDGYLVLHAQYPEERTFIAESGGCRIAFSIENFGHTLRAVIPPPSASTCTLKPANIVLTKR